MEHIDRAHRVSQVRASEWIDGTLRSNIAGPDFVLMMASLKDCKYVCNVA